MGQLHISTSCSLCLLESPREGERGVPRAAHVSLLAPSLVRAGLSPLGPCC